MSYSLGIAAAAITVKIFSLAGAGGLIAGYFSRKIIAALALGASFGILDTLVLGALKEIPLPLSSWLFALVAGCGMAMLGWLLKGRRRSTEPALSVREQPRD